MQLENINSYFGIIEVTRVENNWPVGLAPVSKLELSIFSTSIIHYPDCQQMIIMLPAFGFDYEDMVISNVETNEVIWSLKVTEYLMGDIKIIIDSLFILPGDYCMKIIKIDKLEHVLFFKKYEEMITPINEKTNWSKDEYDVNNTTAEKVLFDENGNRFTMEDDRFWELFKQQTIDKVFRDVEYVSEGRSGKVIYKEGKKLITFYMEMGGGDCIFYLEIPSIADWEKTTKFPLDRRDEIIQYVAQRTQSDQASSGRYVIEGNSIVYYKK